MTNTLSYLKRQLIAIPSFMQVQLDGISYHNPAAGFWILTYHRVLPRTDPEWLLEEPGMCVTPKTFEQNLLWLKESGFRVVPLSALLEADNLRSTQDRLCAITFDDGWADNYLHAFPILKKHKLPATIFLVTDLIGTSSTFWPNRLMRLVHDHNRLVRESRTFAWLREFVSGTTIAKAQRSRLLRAQIVAACKATLSDQRIIDHLDAIGNIRQSQDSSTLLSWDQVHKMDESSIISFGSHGATHLRLTNQVDQKELVYEIAESKSTLRHALGKDVEFFCYPNGDATIHAKPIVQENYAGAVTTCRGVNQLSDLSLFGLMRLSVHEDIAQRKWEFLARLLWAQP